MMGHCSWCIECVTVMKHGQFRADMGFEESV
jgi:hypothetical protein